MLQQRTLGAVVLLGLLAGTTAHADDRRYAEPQIRLGIDILWGGFAPVYVAPPPVVYHPPHYAPPRHAYERGYARGYDRGYSRAKWRGHGKDKHRHRKHRHDD